MVFLMPMAFFGAIVNCHLSSLPSLPLYSKCQLLAVNIVYTGLYTDIPTPIWIIPTGATFKIPVFRMENLLKITDTKNSHQNQISYIALDYSHNQRSSIVGAMSRTTKARMSHMCNCGSGPDEIFIRTPFRKTGWRGVL